MKNYTILVVLVIMAFNACKKESHHATSDSTAAEAIASGPVTSEPTLESFKKGERWIWMEKSVAEGRTRHEGKEHLEVVEFKGSLGLWNGRDTTLISNILNQEQSDTPYRSWPLKVGKKWKYETDWENAEGSPMTTSMEVEVVSYGEEAVLAGRFEAYKIEYKGTITNHTFGKGSEVHNIHWYAPALKMNIKQVQDDGYGSYVLELLDYKSGE